MTRCSNYGVGVGVMFFLQVITFSSSFIATTRTISSSTSTTTTSTKTTRCTTNYHCRGEIGKKDYNNDGHNEDDKESIIDKKLREFFTTSSHFTIAEEVMDSVLLHKSGDLPTYTNIDQTTLQRQRQRQRLFKTKSCHEQIEQCDDDNDNDELEYQWSKIFHPLYNHYYGTSEKVSSPITPTPPSQHKKGQSFKITIAYKGSAFCGWQIQPNNDMPSVQQTLIDILDPLLLLQNNNDEKKQKEMKSIDIRVCGRTDAGVSAIGQVCRVRTLRLIDEVNPQMIQDRINNAILFDNNSTTNATTTCGTSSNGVQEEKKSKNIHCTSVEIVDEKFHPTFGATSRAYAYMIDSESIHKLIESFIIPNNDDGNNIHILVCILNKMARRVERLELDYLALSFGKVKTTTTLCTLHRARISQVHVETTDKNQMSDKSSSSSSNSRSSSSNEAICFEFVGDRFLRRMIRIMVSTLLRLGIERLIEETNTNANNDSLSYDAVPVPDAYDDRFLNLIMSLDRKKSAKPAPSDGLIFVGATFV